MKKLMFLLLFFGFGLTGCTEANEEPTKKIITSDEKTEDAVNGADYKNMRILELKNENMMIGPPATDPEASYPAYEIILDETTKVEGTKNAVTDLIEGDHVNVWTEKKGSDEETAEKIEVIK